MPDTLPNVWSLYEVTEATWPPLEAQEQDGFVHRQGAGGGQRVSSTTLAQPDEVADLRVAEARMRSDGNERLFMVRDGETRLDAALEARGYRVHDPVNLYACPINLLCDQTPPRVSMFSIWEPLHIQREIWAEGGIGPARLNVMRRAAGPKTSIFARWDEMPAGTAYVGISEGIAMTHAVEVRDHQRRKGVGAWMMRAAALWARDNGAHSFSLVTTQANVAANRLYTSLGMTLVGQYHYRIKEDRP